MAGYIGARSVSLNTTAANVQDVTATDTTPEVTIVNTTHEDTDGGREGKVIFKGQQSGGEETTLAEIQGSHDGTADDEKGDLIFRTNDGSDGASPTEAMRIDSAQNVGIGTSSPSKQFHVYNTASADAAMIESTQAFSTLAFKSSTNSSTATFGIDGAGNVAMENKLSSGNATFVTNGNERMRIDSSGNLLVGHTDPFSPISNGGAGVSAMANGQLFCGMAGTPLYVNREDSDGDIAVFRKDGTAIGVISVKYSDNMMIANKTSGHIGLEFGSTGLLPVKHDLTNSDNLHDFGASTQRFDDIYATNGTIQTSDENEKQNIASLTSAEITAATAISKLFKTFKWKDKVADKGDNARTHTGVVAQQVQTAMSDAGLDAGNYAFFISTTWWEKDVEVAAVEADEEKGIEAADAYTRTDTYDTQEEAPEGATERTRMGIRYPELLAFIGAATEQRLTSIEARLTALEAE